jgi:hypothetical protein
MRLTNSKSSWIDIQFALSKLTAVIRGSSPGCRVDKDTPVNPVQQRGTKEKKERKALASARTQQKLKKRTRRVFTSSSSRHRAKTLCHGLLLLRMLFVSIGQSLFHFLRLSQR